MKLLILFSIWPYILGILFGLLNLHVVSTGTILRALSWGTLKFPNSPEKSGISPLFEWKRQRLFNASLAAEGSDSDESFEFSPRRSVTPKKTNEKYISEKNKDEKVKKEKYKSRRIWRSNSLDKRTSSYININSGRNLITDPKDVLKRTLQTQTMSFVMLKEYDKTFSFYQNMKSSQNMAINSFIREGVFDSMIANYSEIMLKHHIHTRILGTESSSLTDLLTAFYIKFRSFLNGVIFFNCKLSALPMKGFELVEDQTCKLISENLLGFSRAQLPILVERLILLFQNIPGGNEIVYPILDMTASIINFCDKYSRNRMHVKRRPGEKTKTYYESLRKEQLKLLEVNVMNVLHLFEGIKLGPDSPVAFHFQYDFALNYEDVIQLWKKNSEIYEPNLEDDNFFTDMIRECELQKLELFVIGRNKRINRNEFIKEESRLLYAESDMFQILLISDSPSVALRDRFLNSANQLFLETDHRFSKNVAFKISILTAPVDRNTEIRNVSVDETSSHLYKLLL